jgi:hypothetical protein
MARDGGEIKIKIAGDSSDLENASARAAKALGDVGGSAAKAGKGVDKAGTKMVSNSRRMAKLSDSAENTKDEFGEMSSSAAALAAALDVVDPRLGAAARGLGDMAGAAEGAVKMTKLQGGALAAVLNPAVLTVTAAVAAMGGAYFLLTKEIKEANEKIEAQDARMATLLPKYAQIKQATMELAVAQGKMTKQEMISISIRKEARAILQPETDAAREKLALAREELHVADEAHKVALTSARLNTAHGLSAEAAAEKVAMLTERSRERLEVAQGAVNTLQRQIESNNTLTKAYVESKEETARLTAATKKQGSATKEAAEATKDWAVSLLTAQEASAALMESIEAEGTALEKVQADRDAMIAARQSAFVDEMQAIDELGGAAEEKNARFVTAEEKMYSDMAAIRDEFNTQELAVYEEMEQANLEHREKMKADAIKAEEDIQSAKQASRDLAISYGSEMSSALIDISSARMDALMANEDKMTAEQKDRAMMQFGIMQAASVAQALIDGYASAAKTMATYGFPAGVPLAAAAIAATGVQVGAIASTPAPSFEVGGMVPGSGAVPITAHGGEGVLTASTTASLGGKSGIAALNNGDISGQLGQIAANTGGLAGQIVGALESRPVQVQVTLGHKQFDKFIAKDVQRPKSMLRSFLRAAGSSRGKVFNHG